MVHVNVTGQESVLILLFGVVYSSEFASPSMLSIFTKGSGLISLGRGEVFNKVSVVEISAEALSVLNKPLFLCFSMLWTI